MRKLLVVGSNSIHVHNYIRLVEKDFDEIFLLSNAIPPTFEHKGEVLNFSLKNPLRAIQTVYHIKKIVQSFAPDIVHIHQANSYALLSLFATRNLNISRILTTWGSDVLMLPKKNRILRAMVRYNLNSADAITADAQIVAIEIERLMQSKSKPILIANFGIQLDVLELPKEKLMYSNRLHKKLYRIDAIIDAFHRFKQNTAHDSWKLIIAATGEETETLKKQAESCGLMHSIEFVGWVGKQDNANYYARSSVFISIPESDATSVSLLEAMASGCFPVVSDLPANRQWVHHGQNGLVVSDLYSNFLSEALQMDFDSARAHNLELIKKEGSQEANRVKFISLYTQMLRK